MFGVAHSFYAFVFLKSVGIGFITSVLWFLIALYRRFTRCGKIRTALLDILYFLIAAFITFLFLLDINAGVLRFYVFAGEGIGFCLFRFLPANALLRMIGNSKERFLRAFSRINANHIVNDKKNTKKTKKIKKTIARTIISDI